MAVYELFKVDLAPIIMKAGETHQGKAKAKGADKPIFSKCDSVPFHVAVPFEGKHEKYITKDEVLKKKLAEFKGSMAQTIYKNLLKVIDTRVAAYADNWKPKNDAAFEGL